MVRLLDRGLEELTTVLFRMGELAENAIDLSIHGFLEGVNVTKRVRSLSEMLVTLSVDVEDKAFELIAKHQPVASDLRIIKSYMKTAYDLERYGRYAWDISFIHQKLAESERCAYSRSLIEEMADYVLQMVHTSIKALKGHDAELAKTLAEIEENVDKKFFQYLDLQVEEIPKAERPTKCIITSLLVVRYLERIADHAAYVGESVAYIGTGEKITLR